LKRRAPEAGLSPCRLIAIDGLGERTLAKAARAELAALPRNTRGGVSAWDASGIFGDLVVADANAGQPSARTLLLLYAADLAFRLRWEIRPALQKKRTVVAAPYVVTAMVFGRAAGLDEEWLVNLFLFAPAPEKSMTIAGSLDDRSGFVEFGCERLAARPGGPKRRDLREAVRKQLKRSA
jgi:thymidylate kinase